MKKLRNKILPALVIAANLFAPSATAQVCDPCEQHCEPVYCCDWNPCCWQDIEFAVEYLWWKPCIDETDFANSFEEDNGQTDVKYKCLCPDWDSGVRAAVYVPCFWCDWSLAVSWTHIDSDDSARLRVDDDDGDVTSPLLHPGLIEEFNGNFAGRFRTADGDWDIRYDEWEVLFSYSIACNSCNRFSPFFGVAGLCLDQKFKVELFNPTGVNDDHEARVKWDSEFWGVGFRAGSYYEFHCNKCFSFFARADGTLLAGEADNDNKQRIIDGSASLVVTTKVDIDDDDCCHFIPGYHIAAGMIYNACFCNFDFALRVGYEFVEWYNTPNPRVFLGDNLEEEVGHSTSASTRNIGFHGLFAGVAITF